MPSTPNTRNTPCPPSPCSPSQAVPAPQSTRPPSPPPSQLPAHLQKLYLLPQTPGAPCPPNPFSPTSCACSPRSLGTPLPSQPLLTCSLAAPCPWAAPSAFLAPLAPLEALTPAHLHSSLLYFLGSALIPGLARCPLASRQLSPGGALSTRAPPGRGPAFALCSSLSLHPHLPLAPCCLQFSGHLPLSGSHCWSSGPELWSAPCVLGGCGFSPVVPAVDIEPGWPCSLAPKSAAALGPSPVGTHSPCMWPCPGTDAGSTGLSRRLHCSGVLSLPCVLRSDPLSVLAGPHDCPAPASRAPGHAHPFPPAPKPILLLHGPQPPELSSPGQQCSWCGAPCLGSVHTLVLHCDQGQLPPLGPLGCSSPSGRPEAGLPPGLSFLSLCAHPQGPHSPMVGAMEGAAPQPGAPGPFPALAHRHMWLLGSACCVCSPAP